MDASEMELHFDIACFMPASSLLFFRALYKFTLYCLDDKLTNKLGY